MEIEMKELVNTLSTFNQNQLAEFTYLLAKEDLEIAESIAIRLGFEVEDNSEQF